MAIISVIMTFFNESPLLLRRSVSSILNQTFTDFEFIVISGNPDNQEGNLYLSEIQEIDNRVKFHSFDTKLLMTVCLNMAIKEAKGDYIAVQEADDESLPDRLKVQYEFMEKYLEYQVCGTAIEYVDNDSNRSLLTRYYPNNNNKSFNKYAAIAHPTILVRKEIYEKYGYYSEDVKFRNSPDFELWVRWKIQGINFFTINKVLFAIIKVKTMEETKM